MEVEMASGKEMKVLTKEIQGREFSLRL